MPTIKLKTHSSSKKRFSTTATGKIAFKNAGKRHSMRKRDKRQIRQDRKTDYMAEGDAKVVSKKFMPYNK